MNEHGLIRLPDFGRETFCAGNVQEVLRLRHPKVFNYTPESACHWPITAWKFCERLHVALAVGDPPASLLCELAEILQAEPVWFPTLLSAVNEANLLISRLMSGEPLPVAFPEGINAIDRIRLWHHWTFLEWSSRAWRSRWLVQKAGASAEPASPLRIESHEIGAGKEAIRKALFDQRRRVRGIMRFWEDSWIAYWRELGASISHAQFQTLLASL